MSEFRKGQRVQVPDKDNPQVTRYGRVVEALGDGRFSVKVDARYLWVYPVAGTDLKPVR